MAFDINDLARRLVIGRKRDGRGIYDSNAKRELVELCRRPGVSLAKMARDCGINANLLATWLRERERALVRVVDVEAEPAPAFIALPLAAPRDEPDQPVDAASGPMLTMQARLPNGVSLEVRCTQAAQVGTLIETLGRLKCFASSKT